MILKAIVNEQGILTVKLPKSLCNQKVLITVQAVPEKAVNIETLFDIFAEADKLDFPRRSHTEILEELQSLRASE